MSKQVWTYILFAYSITWIIVLGLFLLYKQGRISFEELNVYFSFGAVGPTLSAILTTRLFYKQNGLKKLFATLDPGRLQGKSLLLALSPLVFFLIGYCIYPFLSGHWFSFDTTKQQFNLTTGISYLSWALPFVTYALFEEPGWRGFALPHLQEKYTAFKATILLALIWAFWHTPFFLFRFHFSIGITFGFFFGIFVGAIILTSLFNISKGSVLAAILFHLTNNIASAFDKDYLVAVVSTGFVILALYLFIKYKPAHLSDGARVRNYFVRT